MREDLEKNNLTVIVSRNKRRAMSASAMSMALMMTICPVSTSAQESEEEIVLEEISVTGIRASIANSVAKKRMSTSIIEAISAEDLGKLPDSSIAESIARLPGLAAQRLDGRANVISIRGLAPDFTTTTLNGREQVSANNNRAVEFDQFPSELINGVIVHKTTDAKLTAQAVGGTVDLQTVRPLAYGKQAFVMNLRGEYNDLGALNSGTSAVGYRGSFSYIDQFADDTVGIAFGYARMVSPTQEERWNAWGYPDHSSGNALIGGAKPYVKSNELTRDGLMGVVEYEPTDRFNTTIDMYYSKYSDQQTLRGIEIPLAWSGASLEDGYTVENNLITAGTWTDVEAVVRNDAVDRQAETFSVGWNTQYELSDNWSVEADLSFSKVSRTEINLETYSGTGRGSGVGATDTLTYVQKEDGSILFNPGLDYSDTSLIQLGGPLSWGSGLQTAGIFDTANGQDGFINHAKSDDELKAIRLSAERMIEDSFISSIDFGVRYAHRSKTLLDKGTYLTLNGYADDPDNFGTLVVPAEFLLEPTSLAFIGMGDMVSYDALGLYEAGYYTETDASVTEITRSTNSWTVNEKVFNAYIQANIDTEISGIPVLGNFGLQAVHTDQDSSGYAARVAEVNGVATIIREVATGGAKYWNFLPSLNLSFDVAEDKKIRVGVARVLARPRMDQMNPGFSFEYNSTKADSTDINNSAWSGSGGNPELRPFMTWQFDLSYEMYFAEGAYFSVAGFYKKIDSFPFDQSTAFDFSSIIDISGIDDSIYTMGLVTQPQNVHGGKIYGVEISGSLPFAVFSETLDGFGATFSASLTDSEVKETDTSDSLDMPGLSNTVINGTVYYEKHGFQARMSVRYRSDFLGEVSGLSLVRESKFVKAETILDAQVSYDLSEIGVEGLTVLLQVNNLTNQAFTTYQGDDTTQVRDYQNYGRTFLFGLSYKM